MKKEIRVVDDKSGVVQITTVDERWYAKSSLDKKTGLPIYQYVPSVTWIAEHYPKGIGFFKWLADKGWDEAEALKSAAGDKGSKVHYACSDFDRGLVVKMDSKYKNPSTGQDEEITLDEYDCIMTFCDWLDSEKPELLANEITVFSQGNGYAGTIDKIYRINGVIYIVDLKTSQYIWESHKLQLSAYSHADIDYKSLGITVDEWIDRKTAVLQLGYKKNGRGWKFTEIEDKFDLFLVSKQIWANENQNSKPKQKDYPLSIQADIRKKGVVNGDDNNQADREEKVPVPSIGGKSSSGGNRKR